MFLYSDCKAAFKFSFCRKKRQNKGGFSLLFEPPSLKPPSNVCLSPLLFLSDLVFLSLELYIVCAVDTGWFVSHPVPHTPCRNTDTVFFWSGLMGHAVLIHYRKRGGSRQNKKSNVCSAMIFMLWSENDDEPNTLSHVSHPPPSPSEQ